ncbi:Glycosyltransferase [Candidatus Defluviicoccus seviourii]|uniref:Glycosyltransferase n=1 Tax=Candidatus Defluviicoccus seviourii TaxID=2565273 RepID=A0A564WD11_9PROT|nr:Glycosyltransferase [Candidatus Defluviicoccus seviourii]
MSTGLVIGIDAANLGSGGSRTHLSEVLAALDPYTHGIDRIIVWGAPDTLAMLPKDRPWLEQVAPPELNGGLLRRSLWQRLSLSAAARAAGCHILFVPGGSYAGDFHPVVTMSQNMLPFEARELRRYGWSWHAIKFFLLRLSQSRTFRGADGVIFLTEYAKRVVLRATAPLSGAVAVIPHGVSRRFCATPRRQEPIEAYSNVTPFRILYVSTVDHYKHQWHLVEAVALLHRRNRWPLALDLVGLANPRAKNRLDVTLQTVDPNGSWARYLGPAPYGELKHIYQGADVGVFASSCENMPNIILEMMASGLPIASSNCEPMPEILGDSGVFFDPEDPVDIARSLQLLISAPDLRTQLAQRSYGISKTFTWERCARQTFNFIGEVYRKYGFLGSAS